MKIASMTLFCNELFRLQDWAIYFSEYGSDIAFQVIVNNGNPDDRIILQEVFPDAIVLQSSTKNMIASYNLAIQYIQNNTDADAILQITNDLKIEKGGVQRLYQELFREKDYGMISPVLLKRDSEIIDAFGCDINLRNMSFNHSCSKRSISDIPKATKECSGLPGGCFLIKAQIYKEIGLQDEKINMYADEVDLGIRVAKAGYKILVTSYVYSWHQHIFPPGQLMRNPMACYYMGRNHIYIAKKHYGLKVVLYTICDRFMIWLTDFVSCVHHLKSVQNFKCNWYNLKGIVAGIIYK